uniref:Uncharacterized protein n=1 Tax=Chromera velia CCMP2878 TaxID=1169474 RepID=A0A0G4HN96_9ALVE|eukprot:Cvel_7657.t1-p1 / transcript=Cvel_7657.t1 / gene=Cvel_7657 / organism=Chromera_velia_CCMP2878 / gene_product=hypothetical protein / transcript_product=hypothetical protein / location=Cvel_scaffold406:85-1171(-) / protein_length=210 / sequence_SO=supercontig / SO=protein_coding / is_pseudo=false
MGAVQVAEYLEGDSGNRVELHDALSTRGWTYLDKTDKEYEKWREKTKKKILKETGVIPELMETEVTFSFVQSLLAIKAEGEEDKVTAQEDGIGDEEGGGVLMPDVLVEDLAREMGKRRDAAERLCGASVASLSLWGVMLHEVVGVLRAALPLFPSIPRDSDARVTVRNCTALFEEWWATQAPQRTGRPGVSCGRRRGGDGGWGGGGAFVT